MPIDPSRVTYIEPGSETVAQRLEACRDLAACSVAAGAEIEAMWEAEGTEEFLPVHKIEREGLSNTNTELQARYRMDGAELALVSEIESLTRDGAMDLLSRAVDHPAFKGILIDVAADVIEDAPDAMDAVR